MARNNRSKNNHPEGRNQYSAGWMDSARERPFTAAATAAAAVGAGVFLWSRRNQISDQLGNLSDQISDWTENMRSGSSSGDFEMADDSRVSGGSSSGSTSGSGGSSSRTSGRSKGMSETGGGNASLGAHSGGGGSTGSASGRGRAQSDATS